MRVVLDPRLFSEDWSSYKAMFHVLLGMIGVSRNILDVGSDSLRSLAALKEAKWG